MNRYRRVAAIAVSTLTATAATALPAQADTTNTVYVNNSPSVCSDTAANAGGSTTPFCTIPAALASSSVVSGTKLVLNGTFTGGVDITKSGITLQAQGLWSTISGGAYGISVAGQHDVTLNRLRFVSQTGEALQIDSSSNIAMNNVLAANSQFGSTTPDPARPAVSVTGSTGVTLSDGQLLHNPGLGMLIQHSSQVVVSGTVASGDTGGVAVTDSTAVDVVSDTIDENCGAGVSVLGASTDVDIADDIISNARACGSTPGTALTVDTAPATAPTVDSNILTTAAGTPAVTWQGQTFADGPALDAAGDGAHDLTVDPGFAASVPAGAVQRGSFGLAPGSPAIDSADSGARNMPARDFSGAVRTDDPAVDDTGTGPITYADRGAVELALPAAPAPTVSATVGAATTNYRTVTVVVQGNGGSWWPIVSYSVDFGDGADTGTRPYPETEAWPTHTYSEDKSYTGKVTVIDSHGRTSSTPFTVVVAKKVFPAPTLLLYPVPGWNSGPGDIQAEIQTPAIDPYIGSYAVDFGDHTPVATWNSDGGLYSGGIQDHTYTKSGTYTVSVTATDNLGWPTAQPVTQQVTVTIPPATTPPPTTPPPAATAVHRIGGTDRYDTARQVSQAQWKSGTASAVVLARGDQAPDALSGVPLAARVHGPLLLTDPKTLDAATRAEIDRATGGPSASKTVYILGGASAVSPGVEDSLRKAGYRVVRYQGTDRYLTSLAVAESFGGTPHVIVATGHDFPDALAAGPLGAVENAPIILSNGDTLDPDVAPFVWSHQDIDPVGGAAQRAVSKIYTTGRTVNNSLAGPTRYDTAAAVANAVVRVSGHAPTAIGVASGEAFPDALTGGAYAANAGMPLLITEPTSLPDPIRAVLSAQAHTLGSVTVFGGNQAVFDNVESAIAGAVDGKVE